MSGVYEVKVVTNRTTFTKVTLDNAVPGNPYRELNKWGKFDFLIPTLDDQAPLVCDNVWGRGQSHEIQLWRDGVCIWWGVPVKADLQDDGFTKVDCFGLEWVFSVLFFGPIQTNYLTNGNFELGMTGWTIVGGTGSIVSGGWRASGANALRLVTAAAGQESYARQFVSVSAPVDQARVYWLHGTYRIDPTVTWLGPPIYERGLYLARLVSGVVQGDDYMWDPITEDAKHDGSEVYAASPVPITVPAGATQTAEVRAYGPGGAIEWDDLRLVTEESVSTAANGEDVSDYLGRMVAYGQDDAQGKFDLNIGYSSTPTGRVLPLTAEQFFDDGNVWAAAERFVEDGTVDVGIVWNAAGTQRTFTVWPAPGRGSLKAGLQMDLGLNGRVKSFGYLRDSTQAANKVRARGQGTGATRESAEVVDTSQSGGVVIERVINTPAEVAAGGLGYLAAAEVNRAKRAVDIPKFTTHEGQGDLIGEIDLGDTLPVAWDYGWVQEDGTRRVVSFSINVEDDALEPTVN